MRKSQRQNQDERTIAKARLGIHGEAGNALIFTLMSSFIVVSAMAAFLTLMAGQIKENKAIREKMAAEEVASLLGPALSDNAVCNYVLNTPSAAKFDSTKLPYTIELPVGRQIVSSVRLGSPVRAGPPIATVGQSAGSSISSALVVASVQLTIEGVILGSLYKGFWRVNYDPSQLAYGLKPLIIPLNISVDASSPTAAVVKACGGSSAASTAPPCVYGWKQAGGGAGIIASSGYNPKQFSEVFTLYGDGGWGIGCQKGWRLMSCTLTGGGDKDRRYSTPSDGSTWCSSDNEEAGAGLTMSVSCCKAQ